ncbi:MAG: hypothetical protein QGH53_01915, partial [Prochlorococcaceae cyanobacterium ETNP18_MAG_1]|nr:hypothetical protein [Prochlorococcaceae cyanobacterium ETNP18_MAG_1]
MRATSQAQALIKEKLANGSHTQSASGIATENQAPRARSASSLGLHSHNAAKSLMTGGRIDPLGHP